MANKQTFPLTFLLVAARGEKREGRRIGILEKAQKALENVGQYGPEYDEVRKLVDQVIDELKGYREPAKEGLDPLSVAHGIAEELRPLFP